MTTEDAKSYLSKRDIPRLFESLMTGLMYHRPQDHIKYLIDCLQKVHEKGQENITWSSFVDIRRNKTPLPPIANGTARPSSKGSRPSSKTKAPKDDEILTLDMGNIEESLINRKITKDETNLKGQGQGHSPTGQERTNSHSQNKQGSKKVLERNSEYVEEEKAPREKTQSPLPAIPTSTTTAEKVSLPDIPVIIVMGAPGSGKDGQVDRLLKRYPGFQHLNVGKLIKEEIQRRGEAHAKWKLTRDMISRGEAAPEDVTVDVLLQGIKKASSAKGIVITGYPRNMEQVADYSRFVSRIDVVFIIDCDESRAMDKLLRKGRTSSRPEDSMSAVTNRMNYFKAHTLPAAKYYDDQGKLVIIEGDESDDQVQYKFGEAFDKLFFSKYGAHKQESAPPISAGSSLPEPATYKKKKEREDSFVEDEKPLFPGAVPLPPVITVEDTGRKPGLPQCPIIFVAGGPGSGKGTQCQRIVQRYPDFVHISMGDIIRTEISTKGTADDKWGMISTLVSKGEMAPKEVTVDLLKEQLKKHSSAKAFLIEGFPRDKNQVEAFNKEIGGLNFVILFDCEEYYMQTRLLKRGRESGRIDDNPSAIANKLNFYKYNTLPVMKYFDDAGKLVVRDVASLDADRDMDSMFYDISQMFDFAFFGKKPGDEVKKHDKQKDAALQIKSAIEGHQIRSTKKSGDTPKTDDDKSGKEKSFTEEEKIQAAERIQAGFRGYQTRKEIEERLQQKTQPQLERSKSKEEKEAAERIQAGFRGYQTRKDFQSKKEQQGKSGSEAPVQEEIIEETITQDTAKTTGDNVENPSHSKKLDEAAES